MLNDKFYLTKWVKRLCNGLQLVICYISDYCFNYICSFILDSENCPIDIFCVCLFGHSFLKYNTNATFYSGQSACTDLVHRNACHLTISNLMVCNALDIKWTDLISFSWSQLKYNIIIPGIRSVTDPFGNRSVQST